MTVLSASSIYSHNWPVNQLNRLFHLRPSVNHERATPGEPARAAARRLGAREVLAVDVARLGNKRREHVGAARRVYLRYVAEGEERENRRHRTRM